MSLLVENAPKEGGIEIPEAHGKVTAGNGQVRKVRREEERARNPRQGDVEPFLPPKAKRAVAV